MPETAKPSTAERVTAGAKSAGSSAANAATQSVSRTAATNDARTIAALMFFAMGFALVGNEINVKSQATHGTTLTTEPVRIALGGTIATTALVLIAQAGEPGRKFGVGLALVTFASSTLVYGKPVWQVLGNIAGGSKKVQPSKPSTPSKPSSPSTPGTSTLKSTGIIAANLG